MRPYTEDLLTLFKRGTKKISVVHVTLKNGAQYRFLHNDIGNPDEINGLSYQKRLIDMSGLKESPFNVATNRQSIKISTVPSDSIPGGDWGVMAASDLYPLKMAKAESFIYLPATNELLYYWDAYVSQIVATETHVEATLIDASTAAGFCFANQTVSSKNGFTNPDPDEQTAPSGSDPYPGIGPGDPFPGVSPCFVKGTPIFESENRAKFNHNFVKGDVILTFNPETLELEKGSVTEVIRRIVDDYLEITFADKTKLKVTKNHKFYTEHRIFTPICQIPLGTKIYDFSTGKPKLVKLVSTQLITETVEVINFECEPNKNYLAEGKAVHNRKEDPNVPGTQGTVQV